MDIVITIFSLVVLLLSVMIHEVAHGSVALSLGDPTAKYAGRLTLNPLKHLDPFGSVILPLLLLSINLVTGGQTFIFGWAKPVPINPYNFRDQKWGRLKVAIAGPLTNFLLGVFFALLIRFFNLPLTLLTLFGIIAFYNFAWGLFNLIPFPPLDGSHIASNLLPMRWPKIEIFLRQNLLIFFLLFFFFGIRLLFFGALVIYYFVTGGKPLIL